MKKLIVSFICAAAMAVSSSAFYTFADETQPAHEAPAQSETQPDSESVNSTDETASPDSRTDGDPLSETEDSEIPLSFYIGGAVLVVFVLASVVVLIIGKNKKK